MKRRGTHVDNEAVVDPSALEKTLQQPDWYMAVVPLVERMRELQKTHPKGSDQQYQQFLEFFQHQLELGKVRLGSNGTNWDAERKPIDTVVIHHSGRQPGMTLVELNALHLLRLYASEYAKRATRDERSNRPPIFSHHFHDGKQVFYGYHWLLRIDGAAERLLDDSAIGWHAGNWKVNCRSVAICLDNDYEDSEPTSAVLQSLAEFVRKNYPSISPKRVIGHCEANKYRTCPGALFLPRWKAKLLKLLE